VKAKYSNLSEYLTKTDTRVEDFAARVGISIGYVSMIANGQRTPSLPVAMRVAKAADIPLQSLLGPAAEDVA
jgi:transcriptional regulator with XRE-family HTH domain